MGWVPNAAGHSVRLALECSVVLNLMKVLKAGIPPKPMSTPGSKKKKKNKARACLSDLEANHQRRFWLRQISIKPGFLDSIRDDSITS